MVSAVYECGGLKADCWNVPQVACRPECSCFSYGRKDGSTRFNLSKSASSWHKSVCLTSVLPAANRPGDCCECQDAVKYYRGDLWTEQQSRRDSSMYLSAWNDGWLPVGWEKTNNLQMDRKKSAPCVCVCVCVGNFTPTEDDFNMCDYLASPGAVLPWPTELGRKLEPSSWKQLGLYKPVWSACVLVQNV